MNLPPKEPVDLPDLGALSDLAPELARTFVSVASDIALVIDDSGVIRHMALGNDPITGPAANWVGRPWAETASGDTRRKIDLLLAEARSEGVTRRREVSHPMQGGNDIPVTYAAVRLGRNGPVLAVGRDLRAVSAIQEKFVVAQQEMERHYWKQRQSESRYRQLFQVATDAVLVVDALTLHIVEANLAAGELFGCASQSLVGKRATVGVAQAARPAVEEVLVMARTSGRPAEIRALTAPLGANGAGAGAPGMQAAVSAAIDLSATSFRAGDTMLLLVRVRAARPATDSSADRRLTDFVEQSPDAVTITDSSGRVLMANPAFAALCQVTPDGQVVGHGMAGLLGDPQGTLPGILAEARRDGIAELRRAVVGHAERAPISVEISATLLADGDQECIGLTLRRVDARLRAASPQLGELAAAITHLAEQMGSQTLTEMLHEVSALAERHLVVAALARSSGDPHQAARLLGIETGLLSELAHNHGIASDTHNSQATAGPPTRLH